MKKFRTFIKYFMPVIVGIMVIGFVLSRIISPGDYKGPGERIQAEEAHQHTGGWMEVCGLVASADYSPSIGGEPTFLNFVNPHPDQIFTVVIWGENRLRWSQAPELMYQNREICVTGRIEMHRGIPQIVVSEPGRIQFLR